MDFPFEKNYLKNFFLSMDFVHGKLIRARLTKVLSEPTAKSIQLGDLQESREKKIEKMRRAKSTGLSCICLPVFKSQKGDGFNQD